MMTGSVPGVAVGLGFITSGGARIRGDLSVPSAGWRSPLTGGRR
jgi:hypothetical protein